MIIGLIGDSHWGASSNNPRLIQQNIDVWNYALEVFKANGVQEIVDLGDFFDKRKEIDMNLLDIVKSNVIQKLFCPIKFIVGNHNLYYKESSRVNNLQPLKDYCPKYVDVIDSFYKSEDGLCDYIPYITSDNVADITDKIIKSNAKYAFMHAEFSGFPYDKSRLSELTERISRSYFNKYTKVFSGHYHIRSEKDNILYVGTPMQLTWIDLAVDKYIYILNTDTGDLTEYLVPFTLYEQFKLTEESYKEYCSKEKLQGKRVKILYDEDIDRKWFQAVQTKFTECECDSLQYIKIKKEELKENKEIVLDESENILTSLNKYIDNIDLENGDKVKLLLNKVYNSI